MKTAYLTAADFLRVLVKNILPVLLAMLVLGTAFGLARAALPPDYSATAEFYVRNLQSADFLDNYGLTSSQLAAVQSLAKEYASLVPVSDTLADLTIERHGLSQTRRELQGMLSATSDSTVIRITATAKSAAEADAVIAAVTAEYPAWVNETAWPYMHEDFSCVILLREASSATRSSPAPFLMGGIGALLGGFFAYIFFLLRFLFGRRVMDGEEAARVLPDVSLVSDYPTDEAVLRSAILQALSEESHPVLGVIEEQEQPLGLVAALAASFAAAERRVLLIDMALDEEKTGLLNCLAGEIAPEALPYTDAGSYLRMLSLGYAEDAPHLLATPRATELLCRYGAEYDLVVLRFPSEARPLASVLGSCITACYAEITVGRTTVRSLRALQRELNTAGTSLHGLVVGRAYKSAEKK